MLKICLTEEGKPPFHHRDGLSTTGRGQGATAQYKPNGARKSPVLMARDGALQTSSSWDSLSHLGKLAGGVATFSLL